MPSIEHEGPLQLIENAPDLVPRLLRALGAPVPDYVEIRIGNIDFSQLVPTEYRADKVLTLWTRSKRPDLGIVTELQLGVDPRKKFSWPLYNVVLRAQLKCDVSLLVITLDEAVARWAREPITGIQPGCSFTPLVVGPLEMPWVRTVEEAMQEPELAGCRRWPMAMPRVGWWWPVRRSRPRPSWTTSARDCMLIWSSGR